MDNVSIRSHIINNFRDDELKEEMLKIIEKRIKE